MLSALDDVQLDESLLEEQSKIYKVEGVDEHEPAAQKRKRKQYVNGEEVRFFPGKERCRAARYDPDSFSPFIRTSRNRRQRSLALIPLFT